MDTPRDTIEDFAAAKAPIEARRPTPPKTKSSHVIPEPPNPPKVIKASSTFFIQSFKF